MNEHQSEQAPITDIKRFLDDLQGLFWGGQSHEHTLEELSKLLMTKWYAERELIPLDLDNYRAIWDRTRELFAPGPDGAPIFGDIAPPDDCIRRVLEYLSGYAISGNHEIWNLLNHSWLKGTARRDRGQYFTPPLLRRFMVEIYPPGPSDRVCDPCGGSGGLLTTAADRLPAILPGRLFYFDIDHAACRNARAAFALYAHPATGASLGDIHAEARNSLDGPWPTLVDVIYTNVPFGVRVSRDVRQSADPTRTILSAYATGRGRASQFSQVLFLERCLQQMAPGGRFATIVDKGVVTNEKFRRERQILARLGVLELVVELPGVAFEYCAGTTFPTYVLFFVKKEIERTYFARLTPGTLGYDDRGCHGGGGIPTFGPDGEEDGWVQSAFPAIVEGFRAGTLPGAPFAEVRESGDWHHGPHKYRPAGTITLGDIAELSSTPWEPTEPRHDLNPTVDRTFRILAETHLQPRNKTNRLLAGSLLFSRLIAEGNGICCGVITGHWDGSGCTGENYVITPRTPEARIAIWYHINFNPQAHDFLRDHARGQGRGRVKPSDLLKLPVPPLTEDQHEACNKLLQQLKAKAKIDRFLIRRLNELKPDPSE
jgi:type I restriction enzyme M protein